MWENDKLILPVLLSGGNGERLRPLVDEDKPKPFLTLFTDKPLLVETALRFRHPAFAPPIIICASKHFEKTRAALDEFQMEYSCILHESQPRDTCLAIAGVTAYCMQHYPEAKLLITPIDHYIPDFSPFISAVLECFDEAENALVTFGISATRPEPSYGYIRPSTLGFDAPTRILGFEEKPLIDETKWNTRGDYLWNSGIFFGSAAAFAAEFNEHCSEALEIATRSLPKHTPLDQHVQLREHDCLDARFGSFDREVMQKTQNARVLHVDAIWQDLGNWHTISKVAASALKPSDNPKSPKIECFDGNLLVANNAEITLQGLENIVAVANENKVYLAPNQPSSGEKHTIRNLPPHSANSPELKLDTAVFHKPWGQYIVLEKGEGYLTKKLRITPGSSTSLQFHYFRAEHWVVVEGEAKVTIGEDQLTLGIGNSVCIETGQIHRIANQTDQPLTLIETQIGSQCRENDIVRILDDYGRV